MSERLEKHLGSLGAGERKRLLQKPLGEVLRIVRLTK